MSIRLPDFTDPNVTRAINDKVAEKIGDLHKKGIKTTHVDKDGVYVTDGKKKERMTHKD